MLKVKETNAVLAQGLGDGISNILLLKSEGDLFAAAGNNDIMTEVPAAILSHIWRTYQANASMVNSSTVQSIIGQTEDHQFVIEPILDGRLIVAALADHEVDLAVVKAKLEAIGVAVVEGGLGKLDL
eukprot:TRINITY_DN5777_c0_g1_i1.p1 TRINITY_DN5777_c0_g1~~TRINITY_DN5777_c0_g1_i1.p1  ORF type:complete len:127 (+),score=12.03 TRINITY_DN5777_c0_g1_i1:33-413(+)